MDWTNIIMTLITSGAFTAIYLLGDRKTASVLVSKKNLPTFTFSIFVATNAPVANCRVRRVVKYSVVALALQFL